MPVNTNRALAERVDALEARLAALSEALCIAFGVAAQQVPPALRDYRPVLCVIEGGRR